MAASAWVRRKQGLLALGSAGDWVLLGIVGVLAIVAILPASPALYQTPNNDASIFLYAGRQVLAGDLPYRDVYDHKPPLIFYLNAAGLFLGGGSRWGVWVIELISLLSASVLAFFFLRRYFGRFPAALACAAMLTNLALVFERGNLTEEYALPFQFGALFLLSGMGKTGPRLRFFLLGILLGLASSFKQTMAGTGAALAIFLFLDRAAARDWRRLAGEYLAIGLGAAAVWLAWFGYYALIGIFPDFWEASFLMNFGYSSHSLAERLQSARDAFSWLAGSSGFFAGGMLIWLTALPYLLLHDGRVRRFLTGRITGAVLALVGLILLYNGLFRAGLVLYELSSLSPYRVGLIAAGVAFIALGVVFLAGLAAKKTSSWLAPFYVPGNSELALPLVIALVDLPVEFALAILGGWNFPHYFMPLLPSLAILFGYALWFALEGAPSPGRRLLAYAWAAALLLPVFLPGVRMTVKELHRRGDRQIEEAAAYLQANTGPGDPVYQWGNATGIYILSGRSSSSRFFMANPLFFDGYTGLWHTSRLLSDLSENPPIYIIDTQMTRLPLVTAPGWQNCESVKDPAYYQTFEETRKGPEDIIPQLPQGMSEVYYWICQNYAPSDSIGELGWQVYRWKGN